MQFEFKSLGDEKDVINLINFLEPHNIGYRDYLDWLHGVAKPELFDGYKKAKLTFSEGKLVGSAIFQTCKTTPNLVEVKNIRTIPIFEGQLIAKFNLRQIEVESKRDYLGVICDIHKNRTDLFKFLLTSGYRSIRDVPLYTENVLETIMFKLLTSKSNLKKQFIIFQQSKPFNYTSNIIC